MYLVCNNNYVILFRKDQDSKEDLENLLEESAMPLQDLLARYGSIPSQDQSEESSLCIFRSDTYTASCAVYHTTEICLLSLVFSRVCVG